MLLEPTSVVLNSLPGMVEMLYVAAPAGDCVGLGRYTTVPAFGLLLLLLVMNCCCWPNDWRRLAMPDLRSWKRIRNCCEIGEIFIRVWYLNATPEIT